VNGLLEDVALAAGHDAMLGFAPDGRPGRPWPGPPDQGSPDRPLRLPRDSIITADRRGEPGWRTITDGRSPI
jgi:hypothetical protein